MARHAVLAQGNPYSSTQMAVVNHVVNHHSAEDSEQSKPLTAKDACARAPVASAPHRTNSLLACLGSLLTVTGVILYWRAIWTGWDQAFGFSAWSQAGSAAAGLLLLCLVQLLRLPQLDMSGLG